MKMKTQAADIDTNPFSGSPHKNLFAAILVRAWADIDYADDNIRRSALEFVTGTEYHGKFKSFDFICQVLGLEPEMVRRTFLEKSFIEIVKRKGRGFELYEDEDAYNIKKILRISDKSV